MRPGARARDVTDRKMISAATKKRLSPMPANICSDCCSRVSFGPRTSSQIGFGYRQAQLIKNGALMSLLVVGSVAFDGIETPLERLTVRSAARPVISRWPRAIPRHVRLVGVVGEDFTAKDEAVFRGRKIDLAGLDMRAGKSFFWSDATART